MARYKVSFYCEEDQVAAIVGGAFRDVTGLSVVKCDSGTKSNGITVAFVGDPPGPKPQQPRVAGGRKTSETEPGKIILRLFDEIHTAHPIDICTALKKAGYSPTSYGAICAGLITEGMLYRSGRGAYRRPTPLEEVQST